MRLPRGRLGHWTVEGARHDMMFKLCTGMSTGSNMFCISADGVFASVLSSIRCHFPNRARQRAVRRASRGGRIPRTQAAGYIIPSHVPLVFLGRRSLRTHRALDEPCWTVLQHYRCTSPRTAQLSHCYGYNRSPVSCGHGGVPAGVVDL